MVTLKGYTANMLGLSTDQKPTDVDVNTIIRELDTNKYYYFDGTNWNQIPNSGGGGGGDITSANVTAMTGYEIAEEAEAIEPTDTLNEAMGKLEKGVSINENDISTIQGKLTAHTAGGSNYDVINGIRVYVSATAPTGDIPTGSLWIGG